MIDGVFICLNIVSITSLYISVSCDNYIMNKKIKRKKYRKIS